MLKTLITGILIIIAIFGLTACHKVPAGHQGVIVTLYGAEKGVNDMSVGVGRYFLTPNQEMYVFPTFLQNYTWVQDTKNDESIVMQTSEGLSISTDVGITYNIRPENVVKVFQKYRLGVDEITNTFLRNMTRDAMNTVASTMTVEQIYGEKKEVFIKRVNELVRFQAKNDGIDVDKIYLIGALRLPDNVVSAINSKIQASQNAIKVENEVATSRAEAQKTIVEAEARSKQILINAEAQAKANKLLAESLTHEYIQYQALQKWDGKLPTYTGSNAIPFIKVNNN